MGDIIEDYLSTYPWGTNTKKEYKKYIIEYFTSIKTKKPNTYFKGKHDYRGDILKYCKSIQHFAPKTFGKRISTIRGLYKHNEVSFPDNAIKTFRNASKTLRGNKPITYDSIPSKEELEAILSHGGVGEKALFTVLISSGMRVGEALQITFKDIDFDKNPVLIELRKEITKGGFPRITFISEEATKYLQEWLKVRGEYMDKYIIPTLNLTGVRKNVNDNRLFPIDGKTAWKWFRRMLVSSGYTQKARGNPKRFAFHIHSLRKYFRTNMPTGGMSVDMTETVLGHMGYLTSEYRRYNDKQLSESYNDSQHAVTVFGSGISAKDMKGIQTENEIRKQDINDLQEKRLDQAKEIKELQNLLAIYTDEVSDLKKELKGKK